MFIKKIQSCAEDPDVLINGDEKLKDLFLEMTKAFYQAGNECQFNNFSINGKTDLLIPNKNARYFIWEQINRSNQSLLSKARDLDFSQEVEQEINFFNEEEEEEEEAEDVFNDDILGNNPKSNMDNFEEEDEEEEKMLEGSIDKIHISDNDMNYDDESNEDNENVLNNAADEEEISRLLIESYDPDSNQQISYKDLYGDAPPTSDMDDKDLDKDLNETDESNDEAIDSKAKLRKRIEDELVSEKPFHMRGETLASERPTDSLADIDINFDFSSTAPPKPPSTSEIEAILIKRIESMNFDDVVRKKEPIKTASQLYEISTERSKLGLADEYANDYLKEAQMKNLSQDDEKQLTPQQEKAINLWRSLEHELNKFTERRTITKRPKQNITISQSVSLDVEEKPEQTKAPEEIMAPAGSTRQMKGESEISHDERKAERRAVKAKKQKEQTAKDAARGILYSQNGGDGAEVKIQQDIDKLMKGKLQGVEVIKPGEAIPDKKEKPKNINNKFLL